MHNQKIVVYLYNKIKQIEIMKAVKQILTEKRDFIITELESSFNIVTELEKNFLMTKYVSYISNMVSLEELNGLENDLDFFKEIVESMKEDDVLRAFNVDKKEKKGLAELMGKINEQNEDRGIKAYSLKDKLIK